MKSSKQEKKKDNEEGKDKKEAIKGKGKRQGAPGGPGFLEAADLEQIIDELKNEIVFKDQDLEEIRHEINQLRSENLELNKMFKREKI